MKERIIEIQADEELRIVHATATVEPQPKPTLSNGDGKPMYVVGLEGDQHFDIEDKNNSEYKVDLQNALAWFKNDGSAFVASTGDLCQYKDKDLIAFKEAYNSSLPFFTCMGKEQECEQRN